MPQTNTDKAVLALLARVRRQIHAKRITWVHLAERTNYKPNNISRMLNGKTTMRMDTFIRILEAADLQISLRKKSIKK